MSLKMRMVYAVILSVLVPTVHATPVVLATPTPEKYSHIFKFCEDTYKKQLDAGIINTIAANLQAGCFFAVEASLKGDATEYRSAVKRFRAKEDVSALDMASDPEAMISMQFDYSYVGAFDFAQEVLRRSGGQ